MGDFMTKQDELQVVKPTTTVDEGIIYTYLNTHFATFFLFLSSLILSFYGLFVSGRGVLCLNF